MFLVSETVKGERVISNVDKIFNVVELKNGFCRLVFDDGEYFDITTSYESLCSLLPIINTKS